MTAVREQIEMGYAAYTRRTLPLYDFLVLGISGSFVWRCPTARIEAHYRQHVSDNHLEVGVGTGYFVDRCHFAADRPRIGLMDLNPTTLDYTARRIARYRPRRYRRNVLEPIPFDDDKFDSVGINYLLHCLPGTIESKAVAFDHLQALMNPGAIIFGSTLLYHGVPRNWFARRLMDAYNRKGIFSNRGDHLDGLVAELEKRFTDVSVATMGSAALFSGRA